MIKYYTSILIPVPQSEVFHFMDDIRNMGMHMGKSSMAMMGNKLTLEIFSEHSYGPDVYYRWYGKIFWMTVDFTVKVTKWIKDKQKVWGTVGKAKLIVVGSFKMFFSLEELNKRTKIILGIEASRPEGKFYRFLYFILGKLYCKWCVQKMITDTKKHLIK